MNKLNNKQELAPFRGENIPKELIALPQWVAWTGTKDDRGKMSKIPINPSNGFHAKTNDSATWGTFDAAAKWSLQNNLQGVGFVFTENDDFVGIDIDGCLSSETGKMDLTADEIVKHFDSYTEISPSQKGVHIITKGKLPGPGRKNGSLEMYDQKRFFTITGNLFSEMLAEISDCSDQIVSLYEHKFGKTSSVKNLDGRANPEDRALIDKARNAENGDKFSRLWNGNLAGYPSLVLSTSILLWDGSLCIAFRKSSPVPLCKIRSYPITYNGLNYLSFSVVVVTDTVVVVTEPVVVVTVVVCVHSGDIP